MNSLTGCHPPNSAAMRPGRPRLTVRERMDRCVGKLLDMPCRGQELEILTLETGRFIGYQPSVGFKGLN
jgi:hypothetical protein